jgi:hypothetical protein
MLSVTARTTVRASLLSAEYVRLHLIPIRAIRPVSLLYLFGPSVLVSAAVI